MINTYQDYYYNDDTNSIITKDEVNVIIQKYIDENITEDDKLSFDDVFPYYDDITLIGSFTCIEDAQQKYENDFN